MMTVNTHEAKTRLSELLQKIEKKNETVVICRNGHPVAEVRSWTGGRHPSRRNPKLSAVRIAPGAFGPLSEAEWPSEHR